LDDILILNILFLKMILKLFFFVVKLFFVVKGDFEIWRYFILEGDS